MKIFFQRTVPMAALIMAFILCGGCGAAESMPREEAYGDQSGEEMRRNTGQYAEGAWRSTDVAMGTVIQQTLYAPREEASAVSAECMELLEKLEGEELSWRLTAQRFTGSMLLPMRREDVLCRRTWRFCWNNAWKSAKAQRALST